MADRQPNDKLASWFATSGWSKGELARQVNRRARLLGAPHVSTDTSRVRRWLDGEQPREPIPRILSDLFSERYGRVVAPEDLGLSGERSPLGGGFADLPWNGVHTVEALGEFSRSDLMLDRRGFLGVSMAFSTGAALVNPMRDWVDATAEPTVVATGRQSGRLGSVEIEALQATTRKFREWDAQYGGGLRRKAVVGQLNEVTELLKENYPDRIRRRLFGVAAELALLSGWMTYDVGIEQGAQKYFVLALHAAKEAGDAPLGANILTAMSRQMIHVERPQDALGLLGLASDGTRAVPMPTLQSVIHALRARAYANQGDAQECQRAIGLAQETYADRPSDTETPEWLRYFSPAELSAENGHSFRDLGYHDPRYAQRAQPLIVEAIDGFSGTTYVRSRALNLIGLVSTHLLRREPEYACQVGMEALRLTKQVRSQRVTKRLEATSAAAQRDYPQVAEVREFSERVATELPAERVAGGV